jgi:4-amino-4-deoxy-L-arabinose transferase-like glycosyltransferase
MPIRLSRPLLILLSLLVLFLSMDGLGDRKLANPDEGRYSEISREMALSGDFITPRLNGLKYFEKPPLQYWATAVSFSLFGESEFTARLYTALCGLGCILLAAYTGKRLFDEETGLLAGLVLLSAPYFAALNEIATLDMGVTFWMTLSICAFAIAQSAGNDNSRRRWLLLAWTGMAGAVLSKGLIGIVFPAAALFLYCAVHRDFRLLLKLEWLRGLPLFFALAAPWFVMVSIQNPEFPHFFFIHEHFERFLQPGHKREAAWWFFFPILFVGFLPWLVSLTPACIAGWRTPARLSGAHHSFSPLKFFLLFSLFVLLFFSKSSSKLPAYILPIFPVLGIVVAAYLRHADSRRLAWMVLPISPLAFFGAWEAWTAPAKRADHDFQRMLYEAMSVWVTGAAITIGVAALVAFFLLRADRKWLGVLVMSLGTMIGIESIERGYEKLSPQQSGAATAQAVLPHLTQDTRLYSVLTYDQSLPFYLRRTLTLVEYVDEFEMGEKSEPERYMAKVDDFPAAWNAPGPAIAIIHPQHLDKIRALGLSFDIIHQDPRRIALKKTAS